jgi:hypothetical protein
MESDFAGRRDAAQGLIGKVLATPAVAAFIAPQHLAVEGRFAAAIH